MSPAALPIPIEPEPASVPPDDRIRFDEHESLAPVRPEAKEDYPQDTVRSAKPESSSIASMQNGELVAESENLHLQQGPRPQCRCKPGKHRDQHVTHASRP